jgi:hypothetical protein
MHAILVTVDAEYAGVLRVFLRCLERHYPRHPQVVVCTMGWTTGMRVPFDREIQGLRWLDAAALTFPDGPPIGHERTLERRVMYARWAAMTPAFDAYDTVVYLDADTLVLGPLDELFASGRPLAFEDAYPDRRELVFYDPDRPALRRLLAEDGLADWTWETAANAGVLVLPRPYRTMAQLAEGERLAARYDPYLRWGDQSVLNLWLARNGIRPRADVRFNYQARFFLERRERAAYGDARVLHFNGQHGEGPFLMALAGALVLLVPGGRRLVPAAVRLARWPGLDRLPGYRVRRFLRGRLTGRMLGHPR